MEKCITRRLSKHKCSRFRGHIRPFPPRLPHRQGLRQTEIGANLPRLRPPLPLPTRREDQMISHRKEKTTVQAATGIGTIMKSDTETRNQIQKNQDTEEEIFGMTIAKGKIEKKKIKSNQIKSNQINKTNNQSTSNQIQSQLLLTPNQSKQN